MNKFTPTNGLFSLPTLPYSELNGVIGKETIAIHHGKHLKAYIDNLNNLLPDSGLQNLPLADVVRRVNNSLFQPETVANIDKNKLNSIKNNAGQVLNHFLYFEQFSPAPQTMSERMKSLLEQNFGSVEAFKKEFVQQGTTLFGSGWVWLSADNNGKLLITKHSNADNPVTMALNPLLTFDVWEHAYYLDYQNRRGDHLNALWQIVDWSVVENRL